MATGRARQDDRNFFHNQVGDHAQVQLGDNYHYHNNGQLPVVRNAAFNSHDGEHDPRCLPGTRVDLLAQIDQWAEESERESIFWLCGMAGTGKSTIARTVAERLASRGLLGASFFFKRGEAGRGEAARFVTTIADQLMSFVPALREPMREAIKEDSNLAHKALGHQFDKLIWEPLKSLQKAQSLIVVVDALDECEGDSNVRNIVKLFSKAGEQRPAPMRVFVTSRPERSIRRAFSGMSSEHQDFILHEIPQTVIEEDLSLYWHYQLQETANQEDLPEGWPGPDTFQKLLEISIPLFIYAATISRFIRDDKLGDPQSQLDKVLRSQATGIGHRIGGAYLPVLDNLLDKLSPLEQTNVIDDFKYIVGSIVVLFDPLSAPSLASILSLEVAFVRSKLGHLHSVLNISDVEDAPVRLLHLSFREFLTEEANKNLHKFWIDERECHRQLATRCLETMKTHLKKDVCNLRSPGCQQADVKHDRIQNFLPRHAQYACFYWADHLVTASDELIDAGSTHEFLKIHLLHWIEAMCLLECGNRCLSIISGFSHLTSSDTALHALLHDATRFLLHCLPNIRDFPLQIYSSALMSLPGESVVRRIFSAEKSPWTPSFPRRRISWDALLQQFEGLQGIITSDQDSRLIKFGGTEVGFLSGGNFISLATRVFHNTGVASNTERALVRVFTREDGYCKFEKTLEDCDAFTFSERHGWLIFVSEHTCLLEIWDPFTSTCLHTFKLAGATVRRIVLSSDGNRLASLTRGSNNNSTCIKIWNLSNLSTTQCASEFVLHGFLTANTPFLRSSPYVASVGSSHKWPDFLEANTTLALSNDGTYIALVRSTLEWPDFNLTNLPDRLDLKPKTTSNVELWSVARGETVFSLAVTGLCVHSRRLFFTLDDSWLVCHQTQRAQFDHLGKMFDWIPGKDLEHPNMAFAWIWRVNTGELLYCLHVGTVFALSHSGRWIASNGIKDGRLISVWDLEAQRTSRDIAIAEDDVVSIRFSSKDDCIVTTTVDGVVQIWDPLGEIEDPTSAGPNHPFFEMPGYPLMKHISCGQWIATADGSTKLTFREVITGSHITNFELPTENYYLDDNYLAFIDMREETTLNMFSLMHITQIQRPANLSRNHPRFANNAEARNLQLSTKRSLGWPYTSILACTPDGRRVALEAIGGSVDVWDLWSDENVHHIDRPSSSSRTTISFSADGRFVAAISNVIFEIFDLEKGKIIARKRKKMPGLRADSLSFSPDGSYLAFIDEDLAIWVWNLTNGTLTEATEADPQGSLGSLSGQASFMLETQFQTLAIDHSDDPAKSSQRPEYRSIGWGLSPRKDWITFDSNRLLWLRPEWRPVTYRVRGSVFVFVSKLRELLIWDLGEDMPLA